MHEFLGQGIDLLLKPSGARKEWSLYLEVVPVDAGFGIPELVLDEQDHMVSPGPSGADRYASTALNTVEGEIPDDIGNLRPGRCGKVQFTDGERTLAHRTGLHALVAPDAEIDIPGHPIGHVFNDGGRG